MARVGEIIIPGMGNVCRDCTRQLPDDYPHEKAPCRAAKDPSLKITFDPGENLYICSRYNPNLITRLRSLANRVSPMLRAIQSSLPQ